MKDPKEWKYHSPATPGFHDVISPLNSDCTKTWIFRLNLLQGEKYSLLNNSLELNAVLIEGKTEIYFEGTSFELGKCDSFYLPGGKEVLIKALDNTSFFIGGAVFEGEGEFFTRKYDNSCTDKNIRQVHGQEPFRRDVFMTVAQTDKASRLICGITEGDNGKWTSWPPHQHTKDLEEVYCYFNLPQPHFALHLCSRYDGKIEYVHPVSTGSFVIIPEGYHPTVAMPGVKSTYFWVMVAHKPESRRYDLAINDPEFELI